MAPYKPQQSSYVESADISTKLIVKTGTLANGVSVTYDFTSGADRIGDRGAQFMSLTCSAETMEVTITNKAGTSDVVPLEQGGTWSSLTLEDFEIFTIKVEGTSATPDAAYDLMVY